MKKIQQIRVLAIASSGGHWVELRRLQPAWEGCLVTYVTTSAARENELQEEAQQAGREAPPFYAVVEASRWEKIKLIRQVLQVLLILIRVRPHVIISTGAACGFFALRLGKLLGARTIWLDSIANAEELSLSGEKVAGCADLWLTQWEHLVKKDNRNGKLRYEGTVV